MHTHRMHSPTGPHAVANWKFNKLSFISRLESDASPPHHKISAKTKSNIHTECLQRHLLFHSSYPPGAPVIKYLPFGWALFNLNPPPLHPLLPVKTPIRVTLKLHAVTTQCSTPDSRQIKVQYTNLVGTFGGGPALAAHLIVQLCRHWGDVAWKKNFLTEREGHCVPE